MSLRLAKPSSLQAGCSFYLGEDGDEHILPLTVSQNPKASQQTKPKESGEPHARSRASWLHISEPRTLLLMSEVSAWHKDASKKGGMEKGSQLE